jgi:Rha family phage regulatory protein
MNEIVKENNQGENVTTSMSVAVEFGKRHADVLRNIDKLSCSEEFKQLNLSLSSYLSIQNKRLRMYEMTKDGFLFLVKGYKVDKAGEFKEKFIAEFEKQDVQLKNNNLINTPEMKMQDFRRKKILELSAKSFWSAEEALYLNMIVLASADSILSKMGEECIVVSEIIRTHKLGDCYKNVSIR